VEEYVGELWHKLISRAASREHAAAAVELAMVEKTLGVMFRAMGGDAGLRVAASQDEAHGARRRWLERIAGSGERNAPATRDEETLRLPPRIALFADTTLNRDLYLWLAAVAAEHRPGDDWLSGNQQATLAVLKRYPGLRERYERLVEAAIALRIAPDKLPRDESQAENAIRAALRQPGTIAMLPSAKHPPQPVPLWLVPQPPRTAEAPRSGDAAPEGGGGKSQDGGTKRRRAKRVEHGDGKDGFLLMFRAESLLSWAEYIKVNRPHDDDENEDAVRAADEMDELAIQRGGKAGASRVRFDLDLPSAAADDLPLGPGILVPEWDYRKHLMRPDYCRIQPMLARDAQPGPVPPHLRRTAKRLRAQFAALAPARTWLKNQPDGSELDVDACVRSSADRLAGHSGAEGGYLAQVRNTRDMACLVLADLSLSTDAYVSNQHRVIDVIRDSLMLFGEALAATGDAFGMVGFSSLKRDNVRLHTIKEFGEPFDAAARGRIGALKPGYYTRMGAAIRMASRILGEQRNAQRLLLILSDGKPNDYDHYEGRYAIEDTRMSLIEARKQGLKPFCVTIDREGADYLPHLFGPAGFTILRQPEELPKRLPLLYAQLREQ